MKTERLKDPVTNRWKWHADFTCAGTRHRIVADSKNELNDEIDAIKGKARREKYGLEVEQDPITLTALVQERCKDFDLKLKTHRRAKKILENWRDYLGPAYDVSHITTPDLRGYIQERKQEYAQAQQKRNMKLSVEERREIEPLKPDSVNRELGVISACLNAAPHLFDELKEYRPPRMPWEKVSKRGKERVLNDDEIETLFSALRAPRQKGEQERDRLARMDVADLLEIGFSTAMRSGETASITWSQIDWKSGEIHLPKTKSNEPRDVPMNEDVARILRRRYESKSSRYVFPNSKGTAPRSYISKVVQKVALRAGIPYGRSLPDGFTPHVTRHTATTNMLRAGADVGTVQAVTGHSDRTMLLRYTHASRKSKREAVDALLRRHSAKKPTAQNEEA